MIVVQVLILDPQKNGPKSKNEYILQVGCEKTHFFTWNIKIGWLILHSMKASKIGNVHAPNPPAAKFSRAKVGMGFFVGLLGSLTTWDMSDAWGPMLGVQGLHLWNYTIFFGVVKED